MNKIPAAEEFIEKYLDVDCDFMESVRSQMSKMSGFNFDNIPDLMIEFAKLHVKAALEAAADSAQTKTTSCYTNASGNEKGELYEDVEIIDENSILNAYPESNIK